MTNSMLTPSQESIPQDSALITSLKKIFEDPELQTSSLDLLKIMGPSSADADEKATAGRLLDFALDMSIRMAYVEKDVHETLLALQERMVTLALTHHADPNAILHLYRAPSEGLFTLLLAHGLSANQALKLALTCTLTKYDAETTQYVPDPQAIAHQERLVEMACEHGADPNSMEYFPEPPSETLFTILFAHGLNPNHLLKLALNHNLTKYDAETTQYVPDPQAIAHQERLVEMACEHGADPNAVSYLSSFPSETLLATLLARGMDPNHAFELLMNNSSADILPQQMEASLLLLLSPELEPRLDLNNPELDSALGFSHSQYLPLLVEHGMAPDFALYLSLVGRHVFGMTPPLDVLKTLLQKNPNMHAKFTLYDEELTAFNMAIASGKLPLIDLFLAAGADITQTSLLDYISGLNKLESVDAQAEFIRRLPNVWDSSAFQALVRFNGMSEPTIQAWMDRHQFAEDWLSHKAEGWLLHKNGTPQFGPEEVNLLDPHAASCLSIESYQQAVLLNRYGYSALQLALLANNIPLAEAFLDAGMRYDQPNHSGTTALELMLMLTENSSEIRALLQSLLLSLEPATVASLHKQSTMTSGYNPFDSLLEQEGPLRDQIVECSQDSLFQLMRKEDDGTLSPDQVHIAVINAEGFWSTGVWGTARIAMQRHPDLAFHLLDLTMLEKYGEQFIAQFDAVIYPGGTDSYPTNTQKFTATECSFATALEQMYQKMLVLSEKYHLPSFGMCAGAQHLALYSGATLGPLGHSGRTPIHFEKGTLAYYKTLTKSQQQKAMEECELPDMQYEGDTAHGYGAYADLLGSLQLGATSPANVAMAYCTKDGLACATQFHPEHAYHQIKNATYENQIALLENFFGDARQYHAYGQGAAGVTLEETYAAIQGRLDACLEAPTCLPWDFVWFATHEWA